MGIVMPQLAKGGKHVFGWSVVGNGGVIPVPPDGREEYGYIDGEKLVVFSGSRTSGGFSLVRIPEMKKSKLYPVLRSFPDLMDEKIEPGGIHEMKGRLIASVRMDVGGRFRLEQELMSALDIAEGDKLLVARGSGLGMGFISGGPIFKLANEHPELITFE